MSLADIRPYFRTRLKAQSLKEWTDGFNRENIPSTVIDRSFHILTNSISAVKQNQQGNDIEVGVVVSILLKGYRDPASAIDEALALAGVVIADITDPTLKLNQSFKNILFTTSSIDPFDESNDNLVLLTLEFTVIDILCP